MPFPPIWPACLRACLHCTALYYVVHPALPPGLATPCRVFPHTHARYLQAAVVSTSTGSRSLCLWWAARMDPCTSAPQHTPANTCRWERGGAWMCVWGALSTCTKQLWGWLNGQGRLAGTNCWLGLGGCLVVSHTGYWPSRHMVQHRASQAHQLAGMIWQEHARLSHPAL